MNNQVLCHNEVNLVGRIVKPAFKCKINNKNAVKLCLALPNDCDYNLNPNYAYVNVITNEFNFFKDKIGKAIAINGHIETNYGQKIIVDVISFITEKSL